MFKAGLRFESLKSISVLILFVYKLMIESSKNSTENYPKNPFEHKKKKPGLSANRPSNNWAQAIMVFKKPLLIFAISTFAHRL